MDSGDCPVFPGGIAGLRCSSVDWAPLEYLTLGGLSPVGFPPLSQ
jgi:hypothetical protein